MKPLADWNPRFVAYAKAHGHTPEQQVAADEAEYPGGVMTGFISWVAKKKDEFRAAHPEAFFRGIDGELRHICDMEAWDRFLRGDA